MITKRTVLVLGAGASSPYGFPLGKGLRDLIAGMRGEYRAAVAASVGTEGGGALVDEFIGKLRTSGYPSVDWFLEDYPEFAEVGRAAIAASLIPREKQKTLLPPNAPDSHWYELLINAMDNPKGAFSENRLSIVTFNYDRSLEFYLLEVLKTRRGSEERAVEELRSLPIIHVHGSLGPLPPLAKSGRPYSDTTTAETIASAAAHVVVIGDAKDDDAAFRSARDKVGEAERISFSASVTIQRVFRAWGVRREPWDDSRRANVRVNGTSMGLSAPVWQQTKDTVLNGAIGINKRLPFDVYRYLDNYEPLE